VIELFLKLKPGMDLAQIVFQDMTAGPGPSGESLDPFQYGFGGKAAQGATHCRPKKNFQASFQPGSCFLIGHGLNAFFNGLVPILALDSRPGMESLSKTPANFPRNGTSRQGDEFQSALRICRGAGKFEGQRKGLQESVFSSLSWCPGGGQSMAPEGFIEEGIATKNQASLRVR
jgi:hypothetical protein